MATNIREQLKSNRLKANPESKKAPISCLFPVCSLWTYQPACQTSLLSTHPNQSRQMAAYPEPGTAAGFFCEFWIEIEYSEVRCECVFTVCVKQVSEGRERERERAGHLEVRRRKEKKTQKQNKIKLKFMKKKKLLGVFWRKFQRNGVKSLHRLEPSLIM